MYDTIRDAPFGQAVRFLSNGRTFSAPEEKQSFALPAKYALVSVPTPIQPGDNDDKRNSEIPSEPDDRRQSAIPSEFEEKRKSDIPSESPSDQLSGIRWDGDQQEEYSAADVERNFQPLAVQPSNDSTTIVTWYSDTDPDNPHNWSNTKKIWVGAVILFYTLAVYIGASLYSSSIPAMKEKWNLSTVGASAGMALYVVGYGLGPMILSPLSEIPSIGRNPPYIIGMAIFVILCVPTAMVDHYAGMLVLRLLTGAFGSPALASGGASYGDFCGPIAMPYAIALWVAGASCGPALGPVIGNFAVVGENWRWPFWELLWISGPVFLLMFFTLPETSADWILRERAKRLRKLTGRSDLKAKCEVRQRKKSRKAVLYDALIKPWEINAKDPAVLFTTVYTGLTYGIYYSYFESFPMVFGEIYNFRFGIMGVAFLSIAVGVLLGFLAWVGYFYFYADKTFAKIMATGAMPPPEARLVPGLIFTWFIPAGLFLYAWTSRESVHWMVPLIGVVITIAGVFIISQCMLIYLPFTYPKYAGSLYAANGFSRAMLAAAAILFSTPMFDNMGVDKGVTLLAGLCCGCSAGVYILYFFGAKLRARSKFAES
ncbi:Caffeine resistance protein 5 [Cercospora beticola]|uniref:Caffeine resistance protein 5 n=1 Tax=Cercospora beticola TaxID=122368 RepID=A0A2G5HP96_CERBT|nr:Caffeine resistance protein 5 [Cercospora beticola]PIA94360.1 Caffeine resistance protein 5 [Cercospora beticola]WPB05315.1 hypothetical protein RHO25_009967 [Cercospora beticola]